MHKNKYYTPEIEEFHIGFEYEVVHKENWFIRDVPFYPLDVEQRERI